MTFGRRIPPKNANMKPHLQNTWEGSHTHIRRVLKCKFLGWLAGAQGKTRERNRRVPWVQVKTRKQTNSAKSQEETWKRPQIKFAYSRNNFNSMWCVYCSKHWKVQWRRIKFPQPMLMHAGKWSSAPRTRPSHAELKQVAAEAQTDQTLISREAGSRTEGGIPTTRTRVHTPSAPWTRESNATRLQQ